MMFLKTLDKYDLHKEDNVNFNEMDIIAIEKDNPDNAFIFETKIYHKQSYYKKGIVQIGDKYYKYKKDIYKNLKAFYIVFDNRIKPRKLKDNINFEENVRLEIIQIPIA